MKAFSSMIVALAGLTLAACGAATNSAETSAPVFHAEVNPTSLSAWGLFDVSGSGLELNAGVEPYDLNAPLFTDYAHKLRTIWVPAGAPAALVTAGEAPDFPVGTVISKTFYYPQADAPQDGARLQVQKVSDANGKLNPALADLGTVHLVETRLLVRRDGGWEAVSYVWSEDQTDARLTRIGDVIPMSLHSAQGAQDFTYVVPDVNQCAGCHAPNNTTREIEPLGVRPRHMNKPFDYGSGAQNQLEHLQMIGYLRGVEAPGDFPANADWESPLIPLDTRVRSYLDINCSHCHNPAGPADTSGLILTMEATGPELGLCKLPIAAGSGTGGRLYGIVPGEPDESILLHRLETTDPGSMMPELGRSLSHDEGAALVREWIASLEGQCGV